MRAARISLAALAVVAGCRREGVPDSDAVDLHGAGATFPYPLYSKWVAEYQRVDPRVRINYQSIGSGGGIRQLSERTVDFGASDAPMTDAELARAPGQLLHIPTALGAVVVAYNLPGDGWLQLAPEAVAGIFLGEITSWDDARIAAANPGAALPGQPITVVHRTDGSGTTAIFTAYLAQVSPVWAERVGAGKSVRFPVGLGAKGNEGVAGQVKITPGGVGYLELAYARQAGLAHAAIRNRSGRYAAPTLEGITAAAASAAGSMPADMRMSIVNAPGTQAYPLSAFTYVLAYAEQQDPIKGAALARFLWWAVHEGQQLGAQLHYAPLPAAVVAAVENRLRGLRWGGQQLLSPPGPEAP